MTQTTFSKINNTSGTTTYINLDNVRFISVSPDGQTVFIHFVSPVSLPPVVLTDADAAAFLTDLNTFAQGS